MDARLIFDSARPGDWNMAVDEVLLEAVEQGAQPCLRFYGWSEPTLSLGYFQAYDERASHSASADCPVVRRTTGGGAIIHDQELTYSFVGSAATLPFRDARSLYQTVHGALLRCLVERGVVAGLCGSTQRLDLEPFLCFQRRGEGDVVAGPWKICGSAQRRQRRAVLQHGSILLAASPAAPELPGLAELAGGRWASREFAERFSTQLGELLGLTWKRSELTDGESVRAAQVSLAKFAAPAWTGRR